MATHKALYEQNSSQESTLLHRAKTAAALGIIVASGVVGVAKIASSVNQESPTVDPNKPHKVYTAKPSDTAWGISERAFPHSDPREYTGMIVEETGAVISPGEQVMLPSNSHLGDEVPGNLNAG